MDLRSWWEKAARWAPTAGDARAAAPPADRSHWAGHEAERLISLSTAAALAQQAADEHELFEAIGTAIAMHGLNAHLAVLEPGGECLVVRKTVLPWAWESEVERLHGRPMVGMRIELDASAPHRSAVHDVRAVHAPDALDWVTGTSAGVGPAEADAIARFIGLGEALLAPMTDGHEVFGVLTIWAPALGPADRATAEILGRLAGGALAAQRRHQSGGRDVPAPAKAVA